MQDFRVWKNHGYGLAVFFYDDDGNLLEIRFIYFKDLDSQQERREQWYKLRKLMRKYRVTTSAFKGALSELIGYCDFRCDIGTYVGGGGTISSVGAALLSSGPPGWLATIGLGIVALPAIGESVRWDIYRDILVDLEDYIEDWEGAGSSGGF